MSLPRLRGAQSFSYYFASTVDDFLLSSREFVGILQCIAFASTPDMSKVGRDLLVTAVSLLDGDPLKIHCPEEVLSLGQ